MEELVQGELPKIFNLCLRLCRNTDDASDLCQDTFVRAVKSIRDFREESQISTWLYRIAVNTWKNRIRSESRRRFQFHMPLSNPNPDEEGKELELTDTSPLPEEQAQKNETHRTLHLALHQMEPDDKSIVVLKDIEDRSYEDIADILDINVGTVKSRLSRARQKLREIHHKLEGKVS